MQLTLPAVFRFVSALIIALTVAGCTLPRSGPTASEIFAAAEELGDGMHIVPVTPQIAAVSRSTEMLSLGSGFVGAGIISADTINPGDQVSVTVWENVDTGLLAGVGQKVTVLEQIQVDGQGEIYVPYAGQLQASGLSPDELRRKITEALRLQTPDPQVEVRRVAGDGATVSVLGGVQAPGVYPIEAPTRRLSAMLARAGGVALVPEVTQVKIERGGRVGRVWLQDLYDNPSLDIALRADDRIIVEEDRRTFTALGASEGQARVSFNKRDMSAIEAIAAAGGLDGGAADPTGVFIFRSESSEIANRILGRNDLVGDQRVAYVIDLTAPTGLFSARDFIIRDEDTVYITEAPLASWSRVLGLGGRAINLAGSAASLSN